MDKLGDIEADMPSVIREATAYIAKCYGSSKENDMSEVRAEVWSRKMGKAKVTSAPELKTLPPTTEAFEENVRRAHFQTVIWKSALHSSPPSLDATKFGWMRDVATKSLTPVSLPSDIDVAPREILEMIRCGCSSEKPCRSAQCRCCAARLPCTLFCACRGESDCNNESNCVSDHEDSEALDL